MKNVIFRCVGCVLFFIFILASDLYAETYIVKKVIEGDLFELSNGDMVRLIGIDAPDSQPTGRAKMFAERSGKKLNDILAVGKRAKKFVQQLIEGKEVRLEFDRVDRDKDSKILAYVYDVGTYRNKKDVFAPPEYFLVNHDIFINATIIKSGYASPLMIPPNVKYVRLFKKLFNEAKINKRGLWE